MAWRIEFDGKAQKDLAALDKPIAKRITVFLRERVAPLDDPRSIGEFWKYRVGDWRIIASIEDGALRILVVRIGNRKAVYR